MMTADTWAAHLDQALDLHRRLPVFLGYVDYDDEALAPDGGTYIDLAKLCAAGVHTLVASIGFGCYFQTGQRDYHLAGPATWVLEHQVRRIAHVVNAVRRCPAARLVERRDDLDASPADDRVGVIVHLTGNAHTVDLDTVGRLFGQGVRATHPAMQYHNRWCTGMDGLPGLAMTDFGRDVIARLNKLGVVLDVAHASEESARAIIETSSKPPIDSHTTSRDLVPSSRGLRDATLRLIAERGGVIGVHFADHMLRHDVWSRKYVPAAAYGRTPRLWRYSQHMLDTYQDPDERMRWRPGPPPPWDRKVVLTGNPAWELDPAERWEAEQSFYRAHDLPPDPALPHGRIATIAHLADLVDYLVNLVGHEHVGLGGDVGGIGADQWPLGMDHTGHLPRLTAELFSRGYGEDSLRCILSDNWRRVYRECLPAQ